MGSSQIIVGGKRTPAWNQRFSAAENDHFEYETMTGNCWLYCFIIPLLSAMPARFVGHAVGKPLGKAAGHAMAWFFMNLAVGAVHLLLAYWIRPSLFAVDLNNGMSVTAIVLGLMFATPIDFLFVLVRVAFLANREGQVVDVVESNGAFASAEVDGSNPYWPACPKAE